MVFSSFTFLALFLPLFLAAYFLSPRILKNATALFASYLFYAWGAPLVLPVLIVSSLLDYWLSKFLQGKRRRLLFIVGLLWNLGLLVYYKYMNFFIDQMNAAMYLAEMLPIPWTEVALPAGVSFFTFQKISYLADVYSKRTRPADNAVNYLLYVAFFPQLIAGPILRYHDVCEQIKRRVHSAENFFAGYFRFSLGLAKKVLVADSVGSVASQIFAFVDAGDDISITLAWIGIAAYAFQIYFDFSGYSDMAIGIARMLGFHFLENFNMPYISRSITEFWRRWHISLSNWMKEYLYIPLGGNRHGSLATYRNLLLVFFLSGLWHGASWTFVVWGLYHGLFLILDRVFWQKCSDRLSPIITVPLTFVVVCIGWVFFRSPTFEIAGVYLQELFTPDRFAPLHPLWYRGYFLDHRETFFLIIAAICSFVPAIPHITRPVLFGWNRIPAPARTCIMGLVAVLFTLSSVITISRSRFSPFLYFEF